MLTTVKAKLTIADVPSVELDMDTMQFHTLAVIVSGADHNHFLGIQRQTVLDLQKDFAQLRTQVEGTTHAR